MPIHQIKRREFIVGIGAAACSVAARGQQPVQMVGFLGATSSADRPNFMDAFREGLKDFNYIEGKNLALEYRWADGNYDRLSALASDLVSLLHLAHLHPRLPRKQLRAPFLLYS
jgi:putative ABC transport system substrate-binding protein